MPETAAVIESIEQTPEQIELEAKEAKEGLNKGYFRVHQAEPPRGDPAGEVKPKPDTEVAEPDAAAKAEKKEAAKAEKAEAAARAKEAEQQRFIETGPGTLRNVAGEVGGLKNTLKDVNAKLEQLLSSKTITQGNKDELTAGLPDEAEIAKLIEQYDEFKPLADKVERLRAKIDGINVPDIGPMLATTGDEIRELTKLDRKHDDWEVTVNSEAFQTFAVDGGGPSREEYLKMVDLDNAKDPRAKVMVDNWARQHPEWWASKGVYLTSARANDAIKVLDMFAETTKAKAETEKAEDTKRKRERRLAGAVTPTNSGGAEQTTGLTDSQARNRGYWKVAQKPT